MRQARTTAKVAREVTTAAVAARVKLRGVNDVDPKSATAIAARCHIVGAGISVTAVNRLLQKWEVV